MFRKAWSWIRGLYDLVTLVEFAGSVGLAGLLAIVGQGVLGVALQLSPLLRFLLSVFIFLLGLAAALAALKAILERRPDNKIATGDSTAGQDLTPRSSEWSLWQELNRLKSENERLRKALQESEQVNAQLNARIEQLIPSEKRLQFRFVLQAIHRMGNNLNSAQEPDVAAMEKWVSLTSALIRRTLDDRTPNFFLAQDGDTSFAGRLNRLKHIIDHQAIDDVKLQSDFDIAEAIEPYPSEWRNKYGV